ncbi:hypothetical protein TorRG33x02_170180 [Trema orientale]|uniref:Uncharacterized protein n=1 Tax=Trema orientale TaxID=63057 RepID=A0A2P5ENT7_TREOI|nr:hypothetical protein TorRG33x02_170180 [Trema orientale]
MLGFGLGVCLARCSVVRHGAGRGTGRHGAGTGTGAGGTGQGGHRRHKAGTSVGYTRQHRAGVGLDVWGYQHKVRVTFWGRASTREESESESSHVNELTQLNIIIVHQIQVPVGYGGASRMDRIENFEEKRFTQDLEDLKRSRVIASFTIDHRHRRRHRRLRQENVRSR